MTCACARLAVRTHCMWLHPSWFSMHQVAGRSPIWVQDNLQPECVLLRSVQTGSQAWQTWPSQQPHVRCSPPPRPVFTTKGRNKSVLKQRRMDQQGEACACSQPIRGCVQQPCAVNLPAAPARQNPRTAMFQRRQTQRQRCLGAPQTHSNPPAAAGRPGGWRTRQLQWGNAGSPSQCNSPVLTGRQTWCPSL